MAPTYKEERGNTYPQYARCHIPTGRHAAKAGNAEPREQGTE